ncbi:bifunctional aspartate kinase/homoserine dehydrogenase I [Fulvivirgaceae bacterium BMA10]|uniref:Bifunctional aspartate kinase/homoserine dehydrogenase I n=1 Tax=Splendidivirga corallicola TaxID=3051826 RepID=A0ABT8KNM7_9BACT|nr:bifunctional aspartate kinase/homoserine dehydrogenase I [Fulvivirgaceae bacterium BMA10]
MKILKFGGTSVGSSDSIKEVAKIIADYHRKGIDMVVVCSALSGTTNKLVEAGKKAAANDESYLEIVKSIEVNHTGVIRDLLETKSQSKALTHLKLLLNDLEDLLHGAYLLKELSVRTLDLVLSFGERLSAPIITDFLNQESVPSKCVDARKLIRTNNDFGRARVNFNITNQAIQDHFGNQDTVQIVTGFISSGDNDETTTLGRGGSDYTAAILAAALNASEIEIWTDVDGVMTADPRKVKSAYSIAKLSYQEAMEMSHFGAKVIYPPSLQPAFGKNIPLKIRNTFNTSFDGTLVHHDSVPNGQLIKGISSIQHVTLVSLTGSGMVGVPGVSSRLFGALAKNSINVILITQASSEHSISFAIDPGDVKQAKNAIIDEFQFEISRGRIDEPIVEMEKSILAIIGENMRHTPGISAKLFNALGKNGVNISAIAQGSSEINLSAVIDGKNLSKALNAVHQAFFVSDTKTLNIFQVGVGLIGRTLLKQIKDQTKFLLNERSLEINIVALSNTRKMLFSEDGIELKDWKNTLDESSTKANLKEFVDEMIKMNLPNSVFIDNTSNPEIIEYYDQILSSSISIVTPNKLANSGAYDNYQKLKRAAFKHGVKFLYETNVGAGLPVITTLSDLKYSGDEILKIEGILSGTLSYIFNSFKTGTKFSDIVLQAKEKGFTEPDPRDDLNGMDVARKILILAREKGHSLELSDVAIENILPKSCLEAASIDEFFEKLKEADDDFEKLRHKAESNGKVLRFIASLENGKASVKLEAVDAEHPFYSLSGSDNIISFTTHRYHDRPLVIKGPGAGAEVTAAGVFAEIISISNYLYQGIKNILPQQNGKY